MSRVVFDSNWSPSHGSPAREYHELRTPSAPERPRRVNRRITFDDFEIEFDDEHEQRSDEPIPMETE